MKFTIGDIEFTHSDWHKFEVEEGVMKGTEDE